MLIELFEHSPQAEAWPAPAYNQQSLANMPFAGFYLQTAMQQGQLFALLDAVEHEFDAPGIAAKAAQENPENGCCLYTGKAQEKYGHFTPHLVRVTPDILKLIEQKCWQDEGWGYFFISQAPLQKLRRHFKSWLLVDTPEGKNAMFRLQDWRMIYTYCLVSDAQELNAIFGPVDSFIFASAQGPSIEIYRHRIQPYRQPVGQRHQMTAAHVKSFQLLQRCRLIEELQGFIEQAYPEKIKNLPNHVYWSIINSAIDNGYARYKITTDKSIAQWVLLCFALGTDFDLEYDWARTVMTDNALSLPQKLNQIGKQLAEMPVEALQQN